MARRASLYLRDLGFDVVSYGQDSTTSRDSTVVEDHTLHPEWADLVSEHVSGSRVEPRPDSSRYVDVTVRLGASWRLPPKAFYP
jgi:hypothetical protein